MALSHTDEDPPVPGHPDLGTGQVIARGSAGFPVVSLARQVQVTYLVHPRPHLGHQPGRGVIPLIRSDFTMILNGLAVPGQSGFPPATAL